MNTLSFGYGTKKVPFNVKKIHVKKLYIYFILTEIEIDYIK
jgi:hypothetical protein